VRVHPVSFPLSDVRKMTEEYSILLKSRDGESKSKKTERTGENKHTHTHTVVFIIIIIIIIVFRCNTSIREEKRRDFRMYSTKKEMRKRDIEEKKMHLFHSVYDYSLSMTTR
jgi:hypothetical protein